MKSSPDNVDMDRLRQDIPKFLDNSRAITTEAKKWWDDFFASAPQTYTSEPETPTTWLLDELKFLKFGSASASAPQQVEIDNDPNESSEMPAGASQEVAELVSRQLEEIPEVSTAR